MPTFRDWLARARGAHQLLLTIAAGALWVALAAYYGKFAVRIFGLPAIVWVLLIAGVLGVILFNTRWYRQPVYRSAPLLTIVLVFGYLLVALVGMTRGNPPLPARGDVVGGGDVVGLDGGRVGYALGEGLELFGGIDLEADEGLVLAILLCSVIGLLIAALTIPNFWVVGLGVLFLLLALVTWRDARVGTTAGAAIDNES